MPWGPREGRTTALCQRCLKRGRTVRALGECYPLDRRARTQQESIREMKEWLDPTSLGAAPQERHDAIRRFMLFLDEAREHGENQQQSRQERNRGEGVSSHHKI